MSGPLADWLDGSLRLVDIGARAGIDPRWERFKGDLDVLGFEPDADECARLNAARDPSYRSRFLPYALGAEAREVSFHQSRWPVASSVFEPNPEFLADFPHAAVLLETVERHTLTTTPLDAVLEREGVQPDMLKIDVEGGELDVLRGGERALAASLMLDVEVEFAPLFRGAPLFADVDTHLRDRGWQLLGLRRVAWRRSRGLSAAAPGDGGQLVSADALYVNAAARASGLSRSRAVKLAAILSAYRQLDFALSLLHEPPLSAVPAAERERLARVLAPRAGRGRRLATRVLRRLDAARRRSLADALQDGEATVWQDAHHF